MLLPSLPAPLQNWNAQQWEQLQQQQQQEEEEAVAVAAALTTCSTPLPTTDSEQLLQPCSNAPTDDGITGHTSGSSNASDDLEGGGWCESDTEGSSLDPEPAEVGLM